jgi:hypothetical protein
VLKKNENDTKHGNMPKAPIKGELCRLIGGSHGGRTGWWDTNNNPTAPMICIDVTDGDAEGGDVWARLLKHNVVNLEEEETHVEAALNQHLNILKMMNKLCKALAECRLDQENQRAVAQIFKKSWKQQ